MITNCPNNHGSYHFSEKLISLAILNAIEGKPISVYGRGDQVKDWFDVEDQARALVKVVFEETVGEAYNICGHNERIDRRFKHSAICWMCGLNRNLRLNSFRELIRFVADRPSRD